MGVGSAAQDECGKGGEEPASWAVVALMSTAILLQAFI